MVSLSFAMGRRSLLWETATLACTLPVTAPTAPPPPPTSASRSLSIADPGATVPGFQKLIQARGVKPSRAEVRGERQCSARSCFLSLTSAP